MKFKLPSSVRLSNLVMLRQKSYGSSCGPRDYNIASVDVTTGWFVKRTESKHIVNEHANDWYFADTGELVPGDVGRLIRINLAQQAVVDAVDERLNPKAAPNVSQSTQGLITAA